MPHNTKAEEAACKLAFALHSEYSKEWLDGKLKRDPNCKWKPVQEIPVASEYALRRFTDLKYL